jgi:hypothetical protein
MLRRVALVVLTKATWQNIPEDAILHRHRRENLKSYISSKLYVAPFVSVQNYAKQFYLLGFPRT